MVEKTNPKSVLSQELHGVVFVTGNRGIGKTLFGISADLPDNIIFLDWESKGQTWHEQLHFGYYLDVPAAVAQATAAGKTAGAKEQWAYVTKQVEAIPAGKFTTCVIDTVGDFERSLGGEIQANPATYGVKPNQQGGGFGGIYPAMSLQVGNFLSKLDAKGIRLCVAIAHTKPAWAASGPVPNKLKSHGCNAWHDRSILELVLIPGKGTVPAALVQKEQLAKVSIDPETGLFKVQRRLPLRLPEATWAGIRGYLETPANLEQPKEGEVPTEEERQPYSDFFSKEQMEFLVKAAAMQPVSESLS